MDDSDPESSKPYRLTPFIFNGIVTSELNDLCLDDLLKLNLRKLIILFMLVSDLL